MYYWSQHRINFFLCDSWPALVVVIIIEKSGIMRTIHTHQVFTTRKLCIAPCHHWFNGLVEALMEPFCICFPKCCRTGFFCNNETRHLNIKFNNYTAVYYFILSRSSIYTFSHFHPNCQVVVIGVINQWNKSKFSNYNQNIFQMSYAHSSTLEKIVWYLLLLNNNST